MGYIETRDVPTAALYGTVSASFAVSSLGALALLDIPRAVAEERFTALKNRVLPNLD